MDSVFMRKQWRIFRHDAERIARLEREARVPPIVAQLLLARGMYDADQARAFLDAKLTGLRDPDLLPGVVEAAEQLHSAIGAGRKIAVYGDYDCDGMTGTALLLTCLKLLGADAHYYVPNRLEEGYGLNGEALRNLAQRGTSVVVSVDCGINSVEEAEVAREVGIELIITDHHEPGPTLPRATIVHPRLPGTVYPFGSLCGAGVALKLAWALCQRASQSKRVSEAMREMLLSAVGLAAIGTVADVVPLVDENRVLVKHGLVSLLRNPPLGVQALLEITGLTKKSALGSDDIAFTIAPRLNAAGRFGQAQLAIELLTTTSQQRATQLAEYIHELNSSRDSLEKSIYLAANKQIKEQFDPENDAALVLAGRGWHPGVIGLVAGRLAEKHHRPVVLIALDSLGIKPGVGSARSPNGFHLHAALGQCSEHLIGFGGHAAAAGLKIQEDRIEAFRIALCECAAGDAKSVDCQAEVCIDAEGPFSQLTPQLVQQLESMAPFGCGNPRPILCATGVKIAEAPRRIGGGERHLSVKLGQHRSVLRAVGFGHGERLEELAGLAETSLDVAYRPVINDFRGRQSVEIQLVDWRVSQPGRAAADLQDGVLVADPATA
jgi:single-stranded-DNA-specific exonuclease